MQLSSNDLRQVLSSVEALNSEHDPDTLPRRTIDSVKFCIATDVVSFEGFGSDEAYNGPLWFEPAENVTDQMLAAMAEFVPDHPIFNAGSLIDLKGSVRVSDFVTLPEFRRTHIYNEFFRPLGTNRQLSAVLYIHNDLIISCSLCRVTRDYSRRDCSVLDLLVPHLVSAFRGARSQMRLSEEVSFKDISKVGILQVGENGYVLEENFAARQLIAKYYKVGGSGLPQDIADPIRHYRKRIASGEFYFPPEPLAKTGEGGKLVISFLFQSATRTVVLLCEEISANGSRAPSSADLTTRENEVLFWIGQGKTDADIAALLRISVRTVNKHVENIMNKLGVETRTAAVSALLK